MQRPGLDDSLHVQFADNASPILPGTAKYMTRKSETGRVSADGDPAARLEWKGASQNALKKATSTELHLQYQKKQSKANDLAMRGSAEGVRT